MQDLSNWTPPPRPGRVTLEGRHVRIVPLDARTHAHDLFEALEGDEERHRYLYEYAPTSLSEFQAELARKAVLADPLWFAILDRATGRAVGRYTLMRIDEANGVIEIGNILYGPAMAGTAMASEAFHLLAAYVFDLGYRRFEWKCNDANAPSKRAALRYGFTPEGVFRQAAVVKGCNRDTAWFSMLDREWPAVDAAFRAWLAPDNFDPSGRQIRRLQDVRET